MALLSVVVPAYDVQAYVSDCLDSLLQQSFTDIEVIAVDDRSPDRSGEVLDAYAAADERVRVLHLAENVGLGGARNAGLAEASGEYVWFVDSDDWVAGDALEAIAERLADRPDVLLLGHADAHWDGRTVLDEHHDVLAAAPGRFRAADYPAVFRLFPVAWNKVVRRELLLSLELPFPAGAYEDLPVTFPLLAAAGSIEVLDRVCVYYRLRRGSILRSGGAKHLALLDQYELVFERLARLGEPAAPLVPVIYRFMAKHLFLILGTGRIGAEYRRRYFTGATELCRRLRPAGFRAPGGADGIRYRALMRGWWPVVVLLRGGYKVAKGLRHRLGRLAGALGRLARLGRKAALRGYYRLEARRPVDERLALYCANWGRGYTCNPRAIYEKARELAPDIHGVWAVHPSAVGEMPPGVDYVIQESRAFYRTLARAKFLVNNNNFGNYLVKRAGSVFLQTHHGTPVKTMGVDERPLSASGDAARSAALRSLLRRCDNWDFDLSSNVYSTNVWRRAYPAGFTTLEYGYPRNDILVAADPERTAAVRERLGIRPGQRVVLYAPTHREYHTGYQSFFDPNEFVRSLGSDTLLLVRAHYFYGDATAGAGVSSRVLDVSSYPVVEELYLVADVLITDYSSVMFDYAVLDRPIVLYAPDWYAYKLTRGVYFDLAAEPPGLFTVDYDALVAAFQGDPRAEGGYDSDSARALRAEFRRRFCAFDDGHAAERVVRGVLLGEEVKPPAAAAPGATS